MTAARAAIDQARRNEQPIIKIGNEFQPRDIMMNALRRHAAMAGSTGARWDPRFDTDSAFYLPKWKSDAFCNPLWTSCWPSTRSRSRPWPGSRRAPA
jgi:hypothetical protein